MDCPICQSPIAQPVGAINRALRNGAPIYCDRECAGIARRQWKDAETKRAEKAAYDRRRRAEKAAEIRAAKREYHKRTYDPAKARVDRAAKMHRHVEYCRRPEYRAWKRDYDRQFRARQQFGEFAEAALILCDIESEVGSRATRTEVYAAKGTLNKKQNRRRDYDRQHA